MKKILLVLVLVLSLATPSYSQFASEMYSHNRETDGWLQKGYRGFVEVGAGHSGYDDLTTMFITTSHGYQFSQWFFAGVGLGYEKTHNSVWYNSYITTAHKDWFLLFLDLRLTIPIESRFYPYANLKAGAEFGYDNSGYLQAGLGVRYALNEKLGLSVGPYVGVEHYGLAIFGGTISFDF